jgi:hypothetical protein
VATFLSNIRILHPFRGPMLKAADRFCNLACG